MTYRASSLPAGRFMLVPPSAVVSASSSSQSGEHVAGSGQFGVGDREGHVSQAGKSRAGQIGASRHTQSSVSVMSHAQSNSPAMSPIMPRTEGAHGTAAPVIASSASTSLAANTSAPIDTALSGTVAADTSQPPSLRFSWPKDVSGLTFWPSEGHLHNGQSKLITVTFCPSKSDRFAANLAPGTVEAGGDGRRRLPTQTVSQQPIPEKGSGASVPVRFNRRRIICRLTRIYVHIPSDSQGVGISINL
ncbi:unnamed protein product [Protopolystoma xenopodis]|uniref:Uncharacterized protein n=1 Tax=Protopolystoma xenopodis TaxID=117903 RepID=A0A448WLU0_9PLAT|nr:unnamed protein product [Protopolystoma xenopodis]